MTGLRNVPWTRVFAEGTAIVVSILLAFWIQAWWDDKQDREDLQDSLFAVLDDFYESKELVKTRRSFASARQHSYVSLLEIANGDQSNHDEPLIDGLLRDVSWYLSDVPVNTTALDALLTGNKFESLRNDTLRRNLADWPARIAFVETQVSVDKQFAWEIWTPYINRKGLYPQFWNSHNRTPGNIDTISSYNFPITLRHKVNHSKLLVDNEFINLLFLGWIIQENVLNAMTLVEASLDQSIDLLTAELDQSH